MSALQQLSAQSAERDHASPHVYLRGDLAGNQLLECESANMQITLRINRQQRRTARFLRAQNVVPRTFGRMWDEPFGQIASRKLIGRKVELKCATRNGTNGE